MSRWEATVTDVPPAKVALQDRLRHRAREIVGAYSPLLRWYRRLRPRWLWQHTNPLGRATRRYVDEHGLTVRHGPFCGVTYPPSAIGRVGFLPTKLLGAYEADLADILANAGGFDLFVDVGSSDGYYCVGYKRLFPTTQVIGFETNGAERTISQRLASLNGVVFDARGTAAHHELNALPPGRLLLMTDIEGYEHDLVDPSLVPRLRDAMMIIEAHRKVHPDIVEVLCARFERSHEIEFVHARARDIADYQELAGWDPDAAKRALFNARSLWLVLRPRTATP